MNYLAYTWVEQNVNMAEALAMLKKAVELRPEDGFIIDSLGWAYYRMGDYRIGDHLSRTGDLARAGRGDRSTIIWATPIGASAASSKPNFSGSTP